MSKKKNWTKALRVIGLAVVFAAIGGLIGLYWPEISAGGAGALVSKAKELIAEKVAPNAVLVLLSAAGILTAASPSWGAAMAKVVTAVAALSKATDAITGTDANGKTLIEKIEKRNAEEDKLRAAEREELSRMKAEYRQLIHEQEAYLAESEAKQARLEAKLDAALTMITESSGGSAELVRAGRAAKIAAIRADVMKEGEQNGEQ